MMPFAFILLLCYDNSIMNKVCIECGTTFKTIRDRGKYCSQTCFRKHSFRLHNKTMICKGCGKEFRQYASRKAEYCSKECWRASKIKAVCEYCGQDFYRRPSDMERGKHQYCSKPCFAASRLKRMPRTSNPNGLRRILMRRNKIERCERCSFNIIPLLVIHHKDLHRENNKVTNLQVLCPNCHALAHYLHR